MKGKILSRVLALTLVLCMVLTLCPVKAQAAETSAEAAIKNLVQLLKEYCPKVDNATGNTTLNYMVRNSSRCVALGDGSAVNGYPEMLAEELYIDCENLSAELTTVADQIEVVKANREVVASADLITIGFSDVPFLNNALNRLLNKVEAEKDWTRYVPADKVPELQEAVKKVAVEVTGVSAERVWASLEYVAYGCIAYACELPNLLATIREINPDAGIVVVGGYNPLKGTTVELLDKTASLEGYLDYMAETAEDYARSYCADVSNALYVDARYVKTVNTDTNLDTDELKAMVAANSAILNPSEAGHEYIMGRIHGALKLSTPAVDRIAGDSRYETSFAIANEMKKVLGVDKFDAVVLANSDNFADALAGSYLAAVKNAPIIITKAKYAQMTCEYLNENLNEGADIYVLGGKEAMPGNILETLEVNAMVTRLEGSDRYGTNMAILEEARIEGKDLLIATGRDFADSLSASATGLPILLVNGKEGKHLTTEQKNLLKNVDGKIFVIGGESAVPASMVAEIELASGKKVERIAGNSRYETSVEIATEFLSEATSAVVAYASTFPDGLCGGPLAYVKGAPLLLTKNGKSEAPAYTEANGITSGYVLGGTGLISNAMSKEIFG